MISWTLYVLNVKLSYLTLLLNNELSFKAEKTCFLATFTYFFLTSFYFWVFSPKTLKQYSFLF